MKLVESFIHSMGSLLVRQGITFSEVTLASKWPRPTFSV
jgi:hypothetical protein